MDDKCKGRGRSPTGPNGLVEGVTPSAITVVSTRFRSGSRLLNSVPFRFQFSQLGSVPFPIFSTFSRKQKKGVPKVINR